MRRYGTFVLAAILVGGFTPITKATPVQWPVADGGNGHFYEAFSVSAGISWTDASQLANQKGGYLVTITSQAENDFVYNLINDAIYWDGPSGPWIGGYQPPGSPEPAGGWRWVTDEPFIYTNWNDQQPNEFNGNNENRIHFGYTTRTPFWNDVPDTAVTVDGRRIRGYIVETIPEPVTYYVDDDAPGPAHNGSNWATAFKCLQDALAAAWSGDEIRVAQGAYSPEGPLPDIRQASNPNPMDGASGVSTNADLSWTAGLGAASHDVYFGTTSSPPFVCNQTSTTFDPGTMAFCTNYYWRIDEVNDSVITTGDIWSFVTMMSPPPFESSKEYEKIGPAADRSATFQLINGVVIKGGYAGVGKPDPNERDIDKYKTILSGDIGILGDNSDNSFHVVTGSDCDSTAVLDGFTITAGNANDDYPSPNANGGGMYNHYGSPTVNNCNFSGNWSGWDGGGMYNRDSSTPTVTNCTFIGNSAKYGGGMYHRGNSNSTITNCTFSGNSAYEGGGMCNYESSSPTVTNCTFSDNSASVFGGGMYNLWEGNPTVTNCTFIGNSAECGGGMHNYDDSHPTLTNCTFGGNSANMGGGIANYGGGMDEWPRSSSTLDNCILWGNAASSGPQIYNGGTSSATVNYSDVQGGWPGQGNIDADPCFVQIGYWVDANDPNISTEPSDPNAVWVEGDYHLLQTSACINIADNNSLPADTQDLDGDGNTTEPIPFDLEGKPRIAYDFVDMGAYEFLNKPPNAEAGPEQVVECACNTSQGTKVTLDGSNSSDPDRGVLTYTWTGPFVESPVHGATPTVTLDGGCPGEYVITLVVNDGIDDSEPNDVMITVVDTSPPEFELSVSPTILWPPDHKMVEITPSWTVSDDCVPSPDVSLVGIAANEGDDIIGDGHTINDIQIGEDGSIHLRAERSGIGIDRIYTITYQAVDDYGNTTIRSATVSIPHDFRMLARIAARWLWAGPAGRIPEDLNGDGVVNLADVARFAGNWTK